MKDSIINLVLQRMAQGYEEQLPLYERMRLISLEQEQNLSCEEINIDRLMEQISSRQEIIDTLDSLNADILRLKKEICQALGIENFNISTIKTRVSGSGVDELDTVLSKMAVVLKEIKDLDKKNEEALRLSITATKIKLSKIQGAKKANEAYQSRGTNKDGVFIDYSK